MRKRLLIRLVALAILVNVLLAFLPAYGTWHVRAADEPPGPDRFTTMLVDYTAYEWWLISWKDNSIDCQIFIEHAGLPTSDEIYDACGETIHDKWAKTPPCPQAAEGGDVSTCKGYYLYFYQSQLAQRKVGVALPEPVVWLTLLGCSTESATNLCAGTPTLVLTGEEPLPNESITSIAGTVDGEDFSCGSPCMLDIEETSEEGAWLEFWAFSSYGDSSEIFTAQVRVAPKLVEHVPEPIWYVDVLSPQWRGAPIPSCAQSWESFPPVGGPPPWISKPDHPADLASNIPYEYLASNLIAQGAVDVSNCLDGGLLLNGMASPCGLEAAQPAVEDWQNRFDALILKVAKKTSVPAQLLKNLFSRESQFWPGVFTNKPEAGLGQMTENGADTTLLWNPSFYEQFCPLVLEESVCRKGYPFLEPEQQAMLRGALVRSVDAFCEDCPLGIDLRRADFSISVFAETLLANCEQAGQIIRNITYDVPGQIIAYEDLWRFTLVNYNAGPGCLTIAVEDTLDAGEPLDWENLATHLTPVCEGAIDYVNDISK